MTRSIGPIFGAAALAIALSACSGSSSAFTPPARQDARASWMGEGAASQNLLYVSDFISGNVYAYSYPWGKLTGTITGSHGPSAICADDGGHVWVVNSSSSEIVEYQHGGTTPIATLRDPGFLPSDCAVDPVTGDLAVANNFSSSGGPSSPGNVAVYRKARGKPNFSTAANLLNYIYLTYDDKGDLFVGGWGSDGASFALAGLPKGASSLTPIHVDMSFFPSSSENVKWDGKYLAIGDSNTSSIYEFRVKGNRVRKVGTTKLNDVGSGSLAAFCFPRVHRQNVQAKRVVVPNSSAVGYWSYPGGGNVRHNVTTSLLFADGVAVSNAP